MTEETQPISEELAQKALDTIATLGDVNRAKDAINDFTRIRMREQNFYRRIMPPLLITNDELDRQVPTDKPIRVPYIHI